MTDKQKEIFLATIKDEADLVYCYVSPDGELFPPHYNDLGIIDILGEDVYKGYLVTTDNPLPKEPATEETLLKEMASLKIEIMKLRGGHM